MTVTNFPTCGPKRINVLRAALRSVDTSTMTTPEVVDLCEATLPSCTVEEIITALDMVANEHMDEADQLERYRASRNG